MSGFTVSLQAGDCLHLWFRPAPDVSAAVVTLSIGGATTRREVRGPARNPLPVVWESPASGEAQVAWDDGEAAVSLAYSFTPAAALRTGIRVLWTSEMSRIDGARYRFHVGPPFGWMNDPNGLCEVDGVTHLFYQHNPHGRRWDTMHWGHAISRDGIAWVHQPLALLPHEDLVRGAAPQGGAFSGNALPRPDGTVRLFYTDRDDGRLGAREWQMTAVMAEDLTVSPATVLLDTHPPLPGYRNDWRDPFVFAGPDGRLKMLLGGADASGSAVLLYETDDPEGVDGWRFVDILFHEASWRHIPAECPCMIRLDGEDLWVLIFGLIGSRDALTRRRNLTRTHIGRFDGRRFLPMHEHELDFGTDCYAMQVWRGADGPRGIAWAANWTDVYADRDFETAMTLPRRLLWREGRLLTPPIDAVETLRKGSPISVVVGGRHHLENGLAEVRLDDLRGEPLTVMLDHPTHEAMLSYDGETLELHYEPPGNRSGPSYQAALLDLRELRIFVDVGLIEIYVDGGRACCTKRIDSSLPFTAIRLASGSTTLAAMVWSLQQASTRC